MQIVVFGAGAVGGVVGARLHQAGFGVTLIARGAHLEVIRHHGLTLVTPEERTALSIPVVAAPGEVAWTGDDVVLLATKSQDSLGALRGVRDAAGPSVPVVCLQNGVENERAAARVIDSVYGAVVMCPAAHLEPGIVEAYGTTLSGMIDVGRYPRGIDARCEQICAALEGSRFSSYPTHDVMRLKYAKLLLNLGNGVEALCGPGERSEEVAERAREEGRAVLAAAGLAHEAPEVTDLGARWRRLGVRESTDGRGPAPRPGRAWRAAPRSRPTTSTARSCSAAGSTTWPRRSTSRCADLRGRPSTRSGRRAHWIPRTS